MLKKFFDKSIFNKIDFSSDIIDNHNLISTKVKNKNCLIIGGAGTIGLNYIKELLYFKPKVLVVVDFNENALTELTRDLRSSNILDYKPKFITYPVNLMSKTFDKVYNLFKWDVVANFSAHKHVRSEKDKISIEALIKNNIYGAIKLLNLCTVIPPKYFFSVSTDKATDPINIMGASKLFMEKLILSKKKLFRVSSARFANVAFSSGSLLDGFINRLNKKQPLSCPSDIKRFFVRPKQSGQICILATFLGNSGDIFFPKFNLINDQVSFKEIALDFLKANKYEPYFASSEQEAKNFDFKNNLKKYPIYFFESDTTGEKFHEEFYSKKEKFFLDKHKSLGFIKSNNVDISFKEVVNDFNNIFENQNSKKADIISLIKKYIPEFNHKETGKNLDQKM